MASTAVKGIIAHQGPAAKTLEIYGFMAASVNELFSNPGYWLEAAILVVIFVAVNMFPCIKTSGTHHPMTTRRGYLPTPIQALSDAMGRETTSRECCQPRLCLTCQQKEMECECPEWNKRLVPITAENDPDREFEDPTTPMTDVSDSEPEEDNFSKAAEVTELNCHPKTKKGCCQTHQTVVKKHRRHMPLGGRTTVRSHCRYKPCIGQRLEEIH